jgi:hypothetical protein
LGTSLREAQNTSGQRTSAYVPDVRPVVEL